MVLTIEFVTYICHRKELLKLTFGALALRQSKNEGLTLETPALEALYGGLFTLSIQLIKALY